MPRPRRDTAESRSHVSLETSANRHPGTNKRRLSCMEDFTHWVDHELGVSLCEESSPPKLMGEALIGLVSICFTMDTPNMCLLRPSMQ